MASEFAPTMLPNAAAVSRSAIGDLSLHASPCRYLTPARWVPIREAAIDYCDWLGAEAHALVLQVSGGDGTAGGLLVERHDLRFRRKIIAVGEAT